MGTSAFPRVNFRRLTGEALAEGFLTLAAPSEECSSAMWGPLWRRPSPRLCARGSSSRESVPGWVRPGLRLQAVTLVTSQGSHTAQASSVGRGPPLAAPLTPAGCELPVRSRSRPSAESRRSFRGTFSSVTFLMLNKLGDVAEGSPTAPALMRPFSGAMQARPFAAALPTPAAHTGSSPALIPAE